MLEITVLDSVWTQINRPAFDWLNNVLCYDHFYWRKGGYRPEKVVQRYFCIEAHGENEFYFHTGLLDRALDYLEREKVEYVFKNNTKEVVVSDPYIEGYKFRDYQENLINLAIDHGRGQIISPTATGKSIILAGVMSAFPKENILLLVHTNELVQQLKTDAIKAFPDEEIGEWTGKSKVLKRITVATIQSWHKQVKKYGDFHGVILIDEAHHVSDLYGMYGTVLTNSTALTKVGLTATQGPNEKAKWAAECLLGPIIGEYTQQEAARDNVVAVPEIRVYKNSYLADLEGLKDYEEFYQWGIVANHIRNLNIAEIASRFIKEKKTCLITITKIEHGERLAEIFSDLGIYVPFVYGESSSQERYDVIEGLKDSSLRCAICSVVFVEGINIPGLNTVINAAGGVSPVQVVQKVGRALRKTEDKTTAVIVDFLDEICPTLERQSKKRIKIYESKGWKVSKCY